MDTHSSNQRPSPNGNETRTGSLGRFKFVMLGAGVVMAGLLAVGLIPRLQRQAELNANANEAKSNLLTVNTVAPHRAPAKAELALPGNIQAVQETTLYARVDGYLSKRLVDIGDRVEAGQLLAEIDSPEIDRELDQARANLAQTRSAYMQARANLEQARASAVQQQTNSNFNRVSAQRWNELQREGAVARQEYDEKQSAYDASKASVKAAQSVIGANQANVESSMANISASRANVQRLEAMQSYKQITAPFSGVITARNVDSGALITAGSGGSNAVWLYKIAQPGTLRIFIDVPQTYIDSIRPGQSANILVREFPNRVFTGKVTRTSSALDAAAHTLRTEVQVSNSGLKLLPGMYAQVKFTLNRTMAPLVIPANAIVVRSEGTQVAVVGADQKVHFQKVAIGRDFGTEVEITSGLQGNEQLVVNPTDDVSQGVKVKAVPAKEKPTAS
jgi:RND family efflux transporter MFP subunit